LRKSCTCVPRRFAGKSQIPLLTDEIILAILPIVFFVGISPTFSSWRNDLHPTPADGNRKETSRSMLVDQNQINSLDDLREIVYQILCDYEQLEPGIFEMTERILLRRGEPCGTYFCLHGPRNVKYTAIWETDRNSILFYDCNGERFHKLQLAHASLSIAAAV